MFVTCKLSVKVFKKPVKIQPIRSNPVNLFRLVIRFRSGSSQNVSNPVRFRSGQNFRSGRTLVQGTTVPYFKIWEWLVFSTDDRKIKKFELFKVPVLLIITGKPQTLARDITGTQSLILIRFISTCLSAAAPSQLCKTE